MTEKVIVSLSTIPPRFCHIGGVLDRILRQDKRPDEVNLYIPKSYRRFPEHVFCIPQVPEGVTVKVVDEDLGPATKILPCAKENWGRNVRIVYCDDDRLPAPNWLSEIISASVRRPENVIVSTADSLEKYRLKLPEMRRLPRAIARSRRLDFGYYARKVKWLLTQRNLKMEKPSRHLFKSSGFVDFAQGLGGVSIRPCFIDEYDFKMPDVLWSVDDIWLSGAYERKGIGIWLCRDVPVPHPSRASAMSSLVDSIIDNHDRESADLACIKYLQDNYNIWW